MVGCLGKHLIKNGGDKMNMKHYIGIICAVTVVIGAIAGVSANAAENADISEITKTFSMETLIEKMEMKGFEVTVDGDTVTAYRKTFPVQDARVFRYRSH
jgi:hypothetical protein